MAFIVLTVIIADYIPLYHAIRNESHPNEPEIYCS
jgi:hypothetical protein